MQYQPNDPYGHFALAEAARKLGKLDEAKEMYERALQGYEKALGADLVRTYLPALNTCGNLGRLLAHLRRPEEAMEFFQRAFAGWQEVLGLSHERCGRLEREIELVRLRLGTQFTLQLHMRED